MDNTQLVSCVVVTYNTGEVILETLDSIYNQSYENIELIVTDDGSCDETVRIVEEWVLKHNTRFYGTKVLTVPNNTGTCKNLNRGILASHGTWIKTIGDDLLEENAIDNYVNFVYNHPDCQMCVSRMSLFGNCPSDTMRAYIDQWNHYFKKASESLEEQKKYVNKELVFTGPTYFFSRLLYDKVGGVDERFVLLEEWPFCKKVLNNGYRIYAIDKALIKYRVSEFSVCHTRNKYQMPNPILANDIINFFFLSNLGGLIKNRDYFYAFDRVLWHKGLSIRLKHNNIATYYVAKLLEWLSPYKYYSIFCQILKHE